MSDPMYRKSCAKCLESREIYRFCFGPSDYKSMHLLEINYSVPLILHFQRKINYFTASLCKLQSLLFCFLPNITRREEQQQQYFSFYHRARCAQI